MKINIKRSNGEIIRRKPTLITFGEFQLAKVRYNEEDYLLDGYVGKAYPFAEPDFYEDRVYTLGMRITRNYAMVNGEEVKLG